MKVWKRVKNYASMGITSIITGKATHEETSATASRALGEKGRGKYLVVYDLGGCRRRMRLHPRQRQPGSLHETV